MTADPQTTTAATPRSSVAVLLKQALRGEDSGLTHQCLAVDDDAVVRATVASLTPPEVSALLSFLSPRAGVLQPGGASVLAWLHALLVIHAGYLSSSQSAQAQLSSLHAAVSERLTTLPTLLSLQGRLDLVLKSTAETAASELGHPAVYYEEQEEDTMIPEDPFANDDIMSDDDDDL